VTVSEAHADEVTFTEHPIEQGTPITDHAYKNPSRLTIVAGWSNSGSASAEQGSNYVRDVYARLLKLQAAREPITVATGKRLYQNMGIAALAVETDETTEFALMVTMQLRELLIVQTQVVTVPPREVQADPQKTAETTDAGSKQAVPAKSANKTALKALVDGG
jgi:hypothetical protein